MASSSNSTKDYLKAREELYTKTIPNHTDLTTEKRFNAHHDALSGVKKLKRLHIMELVSAVALLLLVPLGISVMKNADIISYYNYKEYFDLLRTASIILGLISAITVPIQLYSVSKRSNNLMHTHIILSKNRIEGIHFTNPFKEDYGTPFVVNYSDIVNASTTPNDHGINIKIQSKYNTYSLYAIESKEKVVSMINERVAALASIQNAVQYEESQNHTFSTGMQPQTLAPEVPSANMFFCIYCGMSLQQDAMFCSRCGKQIPTVK